MLDTIKQFHKEHGYYPNRVQLGKLVGLDRRTVDRRLQEMAAQGLIKKADTTTFVPGDYTVV